MKKTLLASFILLASFVHCVAASYAKDLDACIVQNAGNHQATVDCQCQVSQQYGRPCGWLSKDGGAE